MKIQTGETATVELTVDLQYICSHCKAENLTTGIIRSRAYTATVMGVNVDGDMRRAVLKKQSDKIDAILNPNHPHRFRIAQFDCCCRSCGYREPWARMNYARLEKLRTICKFILGISVVLLAFCLDGMSYDFNYKHILLLTTLVLSIIAHECIEIHMVNNNKKQELLIPSLPQESLPVILPHSEERHAAFRNKISSRLSK